MNILLSMLQCFHFQLPPFHIICLPLATIANALLAEVILRVFLYTLNVRVQLYIES